jgi:hypothetical protein
LLHDSRDEAFEYAIACQRDRRNLTNAELFSLTLAVDKRLQRGEDQKSEGAKSKLQTCNFAPPPLKTHIQTAQQIGTSPRMVSMMRAIDDHAETTKDTTIKDAEETKDTTTKEAVLNGKMSINQAHKHVKANNQKNRRNLTDAEEARLIDALDKLMERGRRRTSRSEDGSSELLTAVSNSHGRNASAKETAKKLGLGSRKHVDQMRAIVQDAKEAGDADQEAR